MIDFQRHLDTQFQNLKNTRKGPIFFIEHGLPKDELNELKGLVRKSIIENSVDDNYWRITPLPYLVFATEIGYRYRGHGTDFWPLIEHDLGFRFNSANRKSMRDLFKSACKKYRGAIPSKSPWTTAFHLIAWPITHALLPIEFHRPLAATLKKLHYSVKDLDDNSLYESIRFAAENVSSRFDTWLSDQDLVVRVARRLLNVESSSEISDDTMNRISKDLHHDDIARHDVSIARHLQKNVSLKAKQYKITKTKKLPSIKGRLQLRKTESRISLEAYFPITEQTEIETLRKALQRKRYTPRLWGVSSRIPIAQLLSGLPFMIKLETTPEKDSELFQGLSDFDITDAHRDVLQSFELELHEPILFAISSDGQIARNIKGKEISQEKQYWILVSHEILSRSEKLHSIGIVGPYKCFKLNPSEPISAKILEQLGYKLKSNLAIGFSGAPPLEKESEIPKFLTGDLRFITSKGVISKTMVIRLGDEEIKCNGTVGKIVVQEGKQTLRISTSNDSINYQFEGIKNFTSKMRRPCWVELNAPELTVQSLIKGNFSIKIDSHVPIEGLELTIGIEAGGKHISVSTILGQLPEIIHGNSALWKIILDDATKKLLLIEVQPTLFVRAGNLIFNSWKLEQRVNSCWWEITEGIHLKSELGSLEYGGILSTTPLESPCTKIDDKCDETVLFSPYQLDLENFGNGSEFTTFCHSPSKIKLELPSIVKPKLKRVIRSKKESAGLEDLVEGYLRWTLAETTTITAELRRRQIAQLIDNWVSELCCGEVWASIEKRLSPNSSNPWDLLKSHCLEIGLGLDPYVELNKNDKNSIVQLAIYEIRRTLPGLWTSIGPPCDLDEDDYMELDLACGRAYKQLADRYYQNGCTKLAEEIEEGDPGTADEDWFRSLLGIKASSDYHMLAELLIPSDSSLKFLEFDYTLMSLNDLTDELVQWAKESQNAFFGGMPERDVLENILMLWIAPEYVLKKDWRGALSTLLTERAIARTLRYIALRSRDCINSGGI